MNGLNLFISCKTFNREIFNVLHKIVICCLYLCDWSQTKDAVQEMEPDAGKLETGTVLTYICQCENLQTGERENGTITVGLPAMTMQEGHQEEE